MWKHQSTVLPFPEFHPKEQQTVGVHKVLSAGALCPWLRVCWTLPSRVGAFPLLTSLEFICFTGGPCFYASK